MKKITLLTVVSLLTASSLHAASVLDTAGPRPRALSFVNAQGQRMVLLPRREPQVRMAGVPLRAALFDVVTPGGVTTLSGGVSGVSLSGNNTWTGTNTFTGNAVFSTAYFDAAGNGRGVALSWRTEDTPDTTKLLVGNLSNAIVVTEFADVSFDFAHPLQTNPTLFIHSANQNTSQFLGLSHDGSYARLNSGTGTFKLDINGTGRYYFDGASFTAGSGMQIGFGSAADPTAPDTGLERLGAASLGVTDGGAGDGSLTIPAKLIFGGGTTATVDGATTFSVVSSDMTLACTGAETINTATGGATRMILVLLNNDTDCTIADDDTPTAVNAFNLTGAATNDVGAAGKYMTFKFDGNAWQQIAESANN